MKVVWTSFCEKLKAKGLTLISTEKDVAIFRGDFTGRDATIGVGATDDGKNVFSVIVIFDSSEDWNSLVKTYDYYRDLYTRKYGTPKASVENNPSYTDSNNSRMLALTQGRVTWNSAWEVTGGDIELSIEKADASYAGIVLIRYRDKQNVENKIQNDLDEI